MKYRLSQTDKKNFEWFTKDESVCSLMRIEITKGSIRGLESGLKLHFRYPITVVAGRNGCGKTTVLAMAACAYHNNNANKILGRNNSYYTFSDFFIQTSEEVPPEGIIIRYQFLFNNWRKTAQFPDGRGLAWQRRVKSQGGRWNNYAQRVKRNVVYLGIGRILPHTENSTSRSYRNYFSPLSDQGWENYVRALVGFILDKEYDSFYYKNYSKYRIPIVSSDGNTYSGFNMGAGENALFEMLSIVLSLPKGMLLIIDEIELGLHEEAQIKLIRVLKELCVSRHIQVICTTHSTTILESVPPEARIYIENCNDQTKIIPEISSAFASGKLSGKRNAELDVLVEDEVAKSIVDATLSYELRNRLNIVPIGSDLAVIRQLAAYYKMPDSRNVCAILDGDKRNQLAAYKKIFLSCMEVAELDHEEWFKNRVEFLPGTTWPENWVLSSCISNPDIIEKVADDYNINENDVIELVKKAIRAGKHNEFYVLSRKLNQDILYIQKHLSTLVAKANHDDFEWLDGFLSLQVS